MKIILALFVALLIINSSEQLASSSFCTVPYHNCIKAYRSDSDLVCRNSKCLNPYSYSCGNIYCSKSEIDCNILLFYKRKFGSLRLMNNHFSNIVFSSEIKKFQVFIESFKKCPVSKSNSWERTDVCLKGLVCRIRKELYFRFEYFQTISTCPCPKKYSYKCETDYCAKDQIACLGLKHNKKNVKLDVCSNNNTIIYESYN